MEEKLLKFGRSISIILRKFNCFHNFMQTHIFFVSSFHFIHHNWINFDIEKKISKRLFIFHSQIGRKNRIFQQIFQQFRIRNGSNGHHRFPVFTTNIMIFDGEEKVFLFWILHSERDSAHPQSMKHKHHGSLCRLKKQWNKKKIET